MRLPSFLVVIVNITLSPKSPVSPEIHRSTCREYKLVYSYSLECHFVKIIIAYSDIFTSVTGPTPRISKNKRNRNEI